MSIRTSLDNLDEKLNTSAGAGAQTFYFDYQDGEYGYNLSAERGADTFHPFKSGSSFEFPPIINLGAARSFDLTNLFGDSASQFTTDNFYVEPTDISYAQASRSTTSKYAAVAHGCTISKSYANGVYSYSGYSQSISVSGNNSVGQNINGTITIAMPGVSKTNLGQITTYNASTISGFENLTAKNFVVELLSLPYTSTGSGSASEGLYSIAAGCTVSKSYDSSTGVFSLSGMSQGLRLQSYSGSVKASTTQNMNTMFG